MARVPAVRPPWPGGSVDVSGTVLYARRSGTPDGDPALFVHGLSGSSNNWTDLMGLLDDLDGHAIDLPGFGRSAPPADYSLDTHVRAVVGYIEHVGRGPMHVFGNSLGGAVVTRLAAERPDLVRTLTLISPALPVYRLSRRSDPRLGLLLLPGLSLLAKAQLARTPSEKRADGLLALIYADPSRVHPQRRTLLVEELERRRHLPWAAMAMERSLRGLVATYLDRSRNLWRQAATVDAPVLHIHGATDRLVPVEVAARAGRVFRDCRVVVLDDVGHCAQLETPERVAELVRERVLPAIDVSA